MFNFRPYGRILLPRRCPGGAALASDVSAQVRRAVCAASAQSVAAPLAYCLVVPPAGGGGGELVIEELPNVRLKLPVAGGRLHGRRRYFSRDGMVAAACH